MKRFLPLISMLIFPVMGWLYALTNRPGAQVYSLVTDLDRAIPLVKVFVLPYSVWIFYIYLCLIYFFIKDPAVYRRSLITYVVCALICYGIYLVFQTTVPRPELVGNDPFTRLLGYVYGRDEPFNCFPSIHCFSSYMVMKALYTSSFRNRINQTLIYGMSSLIIVSTFFVKQHVIFDAFAGIILADVVYRLVMMIERTATVRKPKPMTQRANM
ncbi:phosphatase PAP2 family protein [Paenibacillus lignilyticus]|uniref:Phosphatase PAP2 family protein n=1 Tax=Paenibacillus lignilyticus TaxID=1172615 RepID=A0ABS5C6U7_9BACL|nr:phosphatase PAP2 family protein [Paenibacillus lignilyticus]MBP3961716.1 phosphatase PAP2 family protein [Paenibacillus lignilyticus]MBP3963613.1 phosphatase PAP2 family protein [Paenibacillus lignilyticus]